MKYLLIIAGVATISICCSEKTQNNPPLPVPPVNMEDKILVQNLSHPWEILWGPDNFIWITERSGKVSRINPANGVVTVVHSIPDVVSNGEGGLLGMVLHPDFSANPYVYVGYNYNGNNGYKEKIVRFTYNGTTLSAPVILIDNIDASSIHNGCRLIIKDDKMYITTGDAANQPSAQNTGSLNGKVLRINLDGSIPADNPIANNRMWSWGHRNAQGLVFVGNKLFSSEHGAASDDEINIIEKGRNYGWPSVQGFCNEPSEQSFCTANNVKEPIYAWTPTAAVCGMEFYNSNHIPQLKNSLLVTALKNSRLYQLKLNAAQTEVTEVIEFYNNKYGRLRDVCIAPDGKVYFSTSNGGNDKIVVVSAAP
ncbi:MAG: sorbosone dehydrogenase family protein [Chitinophagaceae bacterium]